MRNDKAGGRGSGMGQWHGAVARSEGAGELLANEPSGTL